MKACIVLGVAALVAVMGPGALAQAPIVTIPGLGDVQGDQHRSFALNRPFYRYRGMPFASPPIGPLRFQPPIPPAPWAGVFNATELGKRCPQTGTGAKNNQLYRQLEAMGLEYADAPERDGEGAEDCLYLSVYTPNAAVGANMPVMIWFHGGGFLTGSGLIYDGERFMDQDVVLIVPHYRLGPLGFLSLQTDEIPGNAGMLDQIAAIQWAIDHISVFGGNPSQITVFGESAGAASASLLNLSPLSTGLFSRYISQSGSATAMWAIDPEPVEGAMRLAPFINCTGTDIPTMTACFQTVDATDFVHAFDAFVAEEQKQGRTGFTCTSPVVQTAGAVRFLEQHPLEIIASGNYVYKRAMLGANKHEGTMVYDYSYFGFLVPNNLTEDGDYLKRGATNYLLELFGVENQGEAMAAAVEKAHIGFQNMGNLTAMTPGIVDFMGNMFLKAPVFHAAMENSAVAPTYHYAFHFNGTNTVWPFLGHPTLLPGGVCHANELILEFNLPVLVLSPRERDMARTFIQLWTNFATYGDPNPPANPVVGVPAWPALRDTADNYMRIDEFSSLRNEFTINEYFIGTDESFPW